MSNQHTGLPNTPEEIRAFIGMQFSSLQFGQETEQPHENDTYTLTAHDLISAFQGLEIDAPVSAEPTDDDIIDMAVEPLGIDCDRMPYGIIVFAHTLLSRYSATPAAAQPDVTQQTLDDVKAGIPARDAEIKALQAAQAQQPGPPAGFISIDAYDRLHALCESQAERLLAIDDMQQPVSGADALLVEEQLCYSGHNPSKTLVPASSQRLPLPSLRNHITASSTKKAKTAPVTRTSKTSSDITPLLSLHKLTRSQSRTLTVVPNYPEIPESWPRSLREERP